MHLRHLLALHALLAAVLACGGERREPLRPATLTVMSFNIRYGTADDGANNWPRRRDLVYQVIREQAPDLLGLQEALRSQLDDLHRALPGWAELGVARDDGARLGEYSAILYRSDRLEALEGGTFWFSDTPETPGSRTWGNNVPRICTWARFRDRASGRTFYSYNLHWDHESQPSRERSAELLAQRIAARAHPDPVLVTGDFNADESNLAVQRLLNRSIPPGLTDAFRTAQPDADGVIATYHGFTGSTTGERIDAILASSEWQVDAADIVHTSRDGRYPSDHFPVTARLSLRGG